MNRYLAPLLRFNRDVRYLLLASAIHGFVFFGIYALLLNLYLLRLGYDPAFVGAANAVGPLALALASLPAGAVSHRIGSRRALVLGFFFTACGLSLLPLGEALPAAGSDIWILTMYGLAWMAGALIVVNLAPYMMAATGPEERSHAFSMQSALFPVAGFAGNLVGGFLPTVMTLLFGAATVALPYRNSLIFAGLLDFAAAWAIWHASDLRATPLENRGETSATMPAVIIGMVAFVWLLRIGSEWTMRVFFNVYLDSVLGASTSLIGALLAAGQLLGIAALMAPFAVARFGKRPTIVGCTLGMALAFVPLILVAHWLAVGVGFVIMMALVSLSVPVYNLFSQEVVAPVWRTTIASVMAMALGVGIASVAFGGGYIILALGYRALFVGGALLAGLAALLFWAFFHTTPEETPHAVAPAGD